jgi:hypothetical protein
MEAGRPASHDCYEHRYSDGFGSETLRRQKKLLLESD